MLLNKANTEKRKSSWLTTIPFLAMSTLFLTLGLLLTYIVASACGFLRHGVKPRLASNLYGSADHNISFESIKDKKILVVGGSGRVGGSVVTQLTKRGGRVTVGSTREESFQVSRSRWLESFPELSTELQQINFRVVDREVASTLAPEGYDLVVHTAGPFQGKVKTRNGVLEACVNAKVPYIDVCDDYCTAMAAKAKYASEARDGGVSCILSTGCWPGVSSLMAKQLVDRILTVHPEVDVADLSVDFSFFTAGSGGAGSTLLVATFLILAEEALTIVKGRRTPVKAMQDYSTVNFGPIVGEKSVAPLNLLETASIHDVLGVGSTKSVFGTAPAFWNTLLGVMAQLPPSLLANEEIMTKLALFSLPIVRIVDYFAGATNAMRCDVTYGEKGEMTTTAIYAHENLEPCVGECVVAFCAAILSGAVAPGVCFPEEAIASGADAAAVLNMASIGAHTVSVESTISISREQVWGGESSVAVAQV